jgi:hypothetical protein
VTRPHVNHENPHLPSTNSRLVASTWLVTAARRSAPGLPDFSGVPPPFQAPPARSWRVTSGPVAATSAVRLGLARDTPPAASAPCNVPVRDPFVVEPAPAGCDALVGIRPARTAAASLAAAGTSNDTRCTAPSWASHCLAPTPPPMAITPPPQPPPGAITAAATAGSITAAATRRSTGSRGSTHRREVDPELTASYAETLARS